MRASSSHLATRPTFDRRAHLVGAGDGSNGVRVAAGVLIGSLLIAGALLVRAAGAHTTHACPCRYPGGVAAPGAVICLDVGGKRSLARCEMVLNNSSWRLLNEPCPIASLTKPGRADRLTAARATGDGSTKLVSPGMDRYQALPRRAEFTIADIERVEGARPVPTAAE
ncbi:MAG: hypothetical protein L0210_04585 [Rhodospirillales bacterium]|nr:hypothetical protein [Rhodospirillales bacterium]